MIYYFFSEIIKSVRLAGFLSLLIYIYIFLGGLGGVGEVPQIVNPLIPLENGHNLNINNVQVT